MADNDRFVIQNIGTKENCNMQKNGSGSVALCRLKNIYDLDLNDCSKCEEGKTRTEYEDIINKVTAKTLDKLSAYATDIEKSEEIAKAVCSRLFGEGE